MLEVLATVSDEVLIAYQPTINTIVVGLIGLLSYKTHKRTKAQDKTLAYIKRKINGDGFSEDTGYNL